MGHAVKPLPLTTQSRRENPWELGGKPDDEPELLIKSLRAALEDAHAAKKAKASFLASVSHELRTPLNAILGFAELISREQFGAINPRYSESARSIEKGARRLLEVLSDILDMAQLESSRMQVFRDHVNLPELIGEVLAILRERHGGEHACVEVRIDPVLPGLWTDRRRLRQILTNVISNALSFTPADGLVTVYGHFAPSGDLEIAIIDSGSGMSPEEAKRAVTRFGHAEEELVRKHQGIGLGLPLAKSLTELLGGRMRIESSKGEGTVVTLDFSLSEVSQRQPDSQMSPRMRRVLGTGV